MNARKSSKLLALFLSLVLCLGLCVPAMAADLTASAAASPDTLTATDAAQTVTVTVTLSEAVQVTAYSANISTPDGWSVSAAKASINNKAETGTAGAINAGYNNGKIAKALVNEYGAGENEFAQLTGFTVTYTVPANAAAGAQTVGLTALEITNQAGAVVLTGANATTTVTVSGSTPATGSAVFEAAVSPASVTQGESVTATLTLKTADALAAGVLQFAATNGTNSLAVSSITMNSAIPGAVNEGNGKISFGNPGSAGAANLGADTLIATVTFATTASTPVGTYTFSVTVPDGQSLTNAAGGTVTPDFGAAATFEVAAPTYSVTVTNDGNGTGSADVTSGTEGTTVTLTATPATGYRFKEWQVLNGGVTVTNDTFTIGTANVEIKAIFELIPTYTVTVTNDGHGTASADPASGASGTTVTLTATPNTGYAFKEWQVLSGGVTVANNAFTIGTANVAIKAVFAPAKGDLNGDGSVTIADAQVLFNYLVDLVASVDTAQADVNGDGSVNSLDIVPLLNLISQLA